MVTRPGRRRPDGPRLLRAARPACPRRLRRRRAPPRRRDGRRTAGAPRRRRVGRRAPRVPVRRHRSRPVQHDQRALGHVAAGGRHRRGGVHPRLPLPAVRRPDHHHVRGRQSGPSTAATPPPTPTSSRPSSTPSATAPPTAPTPTTRSRPCRSSTAATAPSGSQPRPSHAGQLVTALHSHEGDTTHDHVHRFPHDRMALRSRLLDRRLRRPRRPADATSSDYPYADAVERNVLIYGEKLRAAVGTAAGRTAVQTELMRALTDGPGIVVFKRAFGDLSVVDRATEAFLAQIAAEKAAGVAGGDHFAKPGANDRVWGALDKLAVARPRGVRRLLRQRHHRADQRGLARSGLPGHLAGQRGQPRRPGADRAPRLPPRLHGRRRRRPLPGPRAPAVAGADPAGRGRALRHAGRDRPDPLPALLAPVRARLPRLPPARVHRVLPGRTTPSCRWRRATPRSSTPPCSTAPARTSRPTSDGWPTCCRCPRRSAARWRPSTGSRCAGRCSRCCWSSKAAGASDRYLDNVIAASAEGYAFPTNLDRDQPIGGIAPQTQADLVRQAVAEEWTQAGVRVRPGRPGCPHPPAPADHRRPGKSTRCPQSCWPPAGPTPVTRCRWPVAT